MIKAILIIFAYGVAGITTPAAIEFNSMLDCEKARLQITQRITNRTPTMLCVAKGK